MTPINHQIPALELAQHQLADDVHAGVAIVQTGNRGKLLAAVVLEDLGVFLRDFFQRFQAIGPKIRVVTTAMRRTPSFASCATVLSV